MNSDEPISEADYKWRVSRTDGNIIQPFAFTGYQEDEVSGLKFAQARFYSAENGRWMSEDEYTKMLNTGKVQMSPNGNTSYVANPSDINAFGSQAKPGTMYVEFDVDSSRIYQAGNEGWGQIPGPGSLYDRLNIKKGLPPISDMPNAYNISIGGTK